MDIVELKGVNPNMLAGSTSSLTNIAATGRKMREPAEEAVKTHRRKHNNQAFCDLDIVAAHARKKHRSGKKHQDHSHTRGHYSKEYPEIQQEEHPANTRHKKSENKEKSELSKRIEDLTARNEQIKQLLVNSLQQQDGGVIKDGAAETTEITEKQKPERRSHREHKSRRSERSQDLKPDKLIPEESKSPEDSQIKHRSRKDRSLTVETDPKMASTSRKPKITVRLKNNSKTPKLFDDSKEIADRRIPESKSQLVKLTDYQKSKSLDRTSTSPKTKPQSKIETKETNEIITVYENSNILEETDSLSKDTLNKGTSNFTRNDSVLRYDPISEEDKSKEIQCEILVKPTKSKKNVGSLRQKSPEKPKEPKKLRKELSFSNLILKPNIHHYCDPVPKMATTQTSVSRIQTPGYTTLGTDVHSSYFNDNSTKPTLTPAVLSPKFKDTVKSLATKQPSEVISQTAIALRDIMQVQELEQKYQQQQTHAIKHKIIENSSYISDSAGVRIPKPPLKSALSKNSRFRKTRTDDSDRIVEIASKTCHDQRVTFTVEGVEPPKKIRNRNDSTRNLRVTNVCNLQVFPGITITQNDLKEKDFQLLSHGINHNRKLDNLSFDTFNDSGPSFTNTLALANTTSEFRRKESSEVSYKFRKKYWSNKELPKVTKKRVVKEKKKKKLKVPTMNMSVQTGFDDFEDQKHPKDNKEKEKELGISRACQSITTKFKDVSIQAVQPAVTTFPRASMCGKSSQSDSNISDLRSQQKCEKKKPPPPVVVTKEEILTSSGENYQKYEKPKQKHRLNQRPNQQQQKLRKFSNRSTSPTRECHPVMSTGSIRQPQGPARKTRSKSLTHNRDVLVEKINFNQETIKHHHHEIAALEKCLNEILSRLGPNKPPSKPSIHEKIDHSTTASSDNTLRMSSQKLTSTVSTCTNFEEFPRRGKESFAKKQNGNFEKSKIKLKPLNVKSSKPMSKFHRRKHYGERLQKRYRKKDKSQNTNLLTTPVKVRSVFKNRGFISSATSMSSKISDLGSSGLSNYPRSIPSMNICCCSVNKPIDYPISQDRKKQQQNLQKIVKNKHKLKQKQSQLKYSKKKTRSIYDMLLQYINLTKDQNQAATQNPEFSIPPNLNLDSDESSSKGTFKLSEEESRIVILSVSSMKVRKPSNLIPGPSSPPEKRKKLLKRPDPKEIQEDSTDSDRTPRNEPFFIAKDPPPKLKIVKKLPLSSEDSLENEVKPPAPNLCPLTAIFNFEPPKQNYLVYNTEVITSYKPKSEVKSATPSPSSSTTPSIGGSSTPRKSKLKTIVEEKPQVAKLSHPDDEVVAKTLPTIADLSPILTRRTTYPSYVDVMNSLENMDLPKTKPKLTTFNCNDRECSNLIFNYTSKKDSVKSSKTASRSPSTDRHASSAYHTMTSVLDSKSGSLQTPSESDVGIKNESGYESSKKSTSFMNFFKKKTLMEVFRSKVRSKRSIESGLTIDRGLELRDKKSPACIISETSLNRSEQSEDEDIPCQDHHHQDVERDQIESPYADNKTVLWFNFRKKKREAGQGCDPWCANRTTRSDQTEMPDACAGLCHKSTKCMSTSTWKGFLRTECPCHQPFDKQRELCKKYASKVLMEAAKREKGYQRQYEDFEEMPLKVLMANKKCACKTMNQGCTKSFANKTAGVQAKAPVVSERVQVKVKKPSVKPEPKNSIKKSSVVHKNETDDETVGKQREDDEPRVNFKSPRGSIKDEEERLESFDQDEEEDDYIYDDEYMLGQSPEDSEGAVGGRSDPKIRDKADDREVKAVAPNTIRSFTDQEVFDRLLREYERKDAIATRLSADEVFQHEQIQAANSGDVPDLQVQPDRNQQSDQEERMRGPRFSDRPRPMVHITTETAVRPDDIGTCFARGFRPDNLMLSGDACFHINKQDKLKMSPYMLKNTESIIDFSERETPLDFLLALGFMVDEASNALKDDDIRSRLLAAITEARVWINKITTTQGTLLYLVAYKARPETMRYFLQLVEAIINRRINNAIRLDGFLRVLEDVEAGRVQMINILGEDKFEDEENEEKIVKKQLKSLFVSVYGVAEKEAAVSGRTLNPNQVSLLRILVAKYRAGLHPHLELIARYIGQGLLENEIQLEAAMIFLSRLDTAEVKLKEFENYCGITCQLQDT